MPRPRKYDGQTDKERHVQASAAYYAKKLDRVNLTMPKGEKKTIQAAAAAAGVSLNEFIRAAIKEKIYRDAARLPVPCDTADGTKAADDTTKKRERKK